MQTDNSNEVQVVVREEGQHTHFSQIPNIIDDMNLSSTAIRLYLHLKRVAGENGSCYQSERTIAQHCRMGRNTIPRVKMELIKAGLISVADETINGKQFRILIICNIWDKNAAHFQALKEKKREEAVLNGATRLQTAPGVALNSADGVALNSAQRIYPIKEEPTKNIKKEIIKKEESVFMLPDWVNPETWEAFLEMRRNRRSPPTEYAKRLIIAELARIMANGQDPNDALNQSIKNSWKDVYALKERTYQNGTDKKYTPRRSYSTEELAASVGKPLD